jgi:rhodanese-related sulfurtransferase
MARCPSARISAALIGAILLATVACREEAQPGYPTQIRPAELAERIGARDEPLILDVRSPEEYMAGHIPGAANVPHTQLAFRLNELGVDKSDEVVVYCQAGGRAGRAKRVLMRAGYRKVRDLRGHMQAWQQGGYPTE